MKKGLKDETMMDELRSLTVKLNLKGRKKGQGPKGRNWPICAASRLSASDVLSSPPFSRGP